MLETVTAADLLKTEGIITVTPDTPLSQALTKLTSSHDAIFVAEGKKLLGLISPYHVLYRSHFPPEAKVQHCLFSPPAIALDTPLPQIAAHMIESKVYFLPVMNREWEGIVTKNRILEFLSKTPLPPAFNRLRRPKKMVTTTANITIGKARNLMKAGGIARLLITDEHGHLEGILTRSDLQRAFSQPKEGIEAMSRVGEKVSESNESIIGYIKKAVITAPEQTSPDKLLRLLVDNNVGSVVLIDENNHPSGIVTTKDVLQILTELQPAAGVDITLAIDDGFSATPLLLQVLQKDVDKLRRHHEITDLTLKLHCERNAAHEISRYKITLSGHHVKKGTVIAQTEHPEWKIALHEALDKLEHQVRNRHYG